jgi:hypothetical protein
MYILQIALGDIPEKIAYCMSTVQRYAQEQKLEYHLITTEPKHLLQYPKCIISNEIRLVEACKHEVFYIDWDVTIDMSFVISETLLSVDRRNPDAVFVSRDTDYWKQIKTDLDSLSNRSRYHRCALWTTLFKRGGFSFLTSGYKHLSYHKESLL